MRLRARSTPRLTNQLRLALEPECLENSQATAREDLQDGADSIRDTQAACGFRYWASKHAPFFHTINTLVAIFLAKVSRALAAKELPSVNKSLAQKKLEPVQQLTGKAWDAANGDSGGTGSTGSAIRERD